MRPEVLLFDIGNTSIKIGLADREKVLASYTLCTDTRQTADNLGLTLLTLLGHAGVSAGQIAAPMRPAACIRRRRRFWWWTLARP